ncbi:MAG: amidase [Herminiimonas sp.]|nr:amidase [Herminiimonas sp.]
MTIPISGPIATLAATSRRALVIKSLDAAASSVSLFTKLYPDAAIAVASHADAMHAAGVPAPSPLAGLPVSIKDLFDVAGEATQAGSLVLKDAPPASSDAPAVQRLRAAGAAIIGKTNMTEFAFSGIGLNPHYGTPVNPADDHVARIPGGSSSGAAVSVAAGICVASLGSDTGGSVRIPAALCGVVGFKPTARRVPTLGALPLSTTLDSIGAITRSVADCILLDGILASAALNIRDLPLAAFHLLIPSTLMMDDLEPHVATSFAHALSILSAAGARITEAPLALLADSTALNKFSAIEAFAWHRRLLEAHEELYDRRVAKRIKLGAQMLAVDYIDMHAARRAWINGVEAELMPYDAMIMPTVPTVAPPIAELEASDDMFFAANSRMLRNCSAINLLDGCAISLPCHATGSLPVGLMVAGPALHDGEVLAVARAIELALKQQ